MNNSAYCLATLIILSNAAQAAGEFAQCQPGSLGQQKVQAQSNVLSDPQRIAELEQILVDLRAIQQGVSGKAKVPAGFVDNCFVAKKEMVSLQFSKLSPNTQNSHKVLKLMGQITDAAFEHSEAVKFYEAAYELNPADKESALRGLRLYSGLEMQNMTVNQKTLTPEQKTQILRNLLERGYGISDNPKFSREERLWALDQVQGAMASIALQPHIEEPHWKKVLALAPDSEKALRSLMAVYQARGDFAKMSLYAGKLALHPSAQESDIDSIGLALSKSEDFSTLLKVGVHLSNRFPKNAEVWGYVGIAEYHLKLHDKASEHLQKALALKTKNPAVTTSYANLLENLGDNAAKDQNWLEAMAKYREALNFKGQSVQLKKKTAFLILDYYNEVKFPEGASTAKDMDYALGLLKDSLQSKVPLMSDYAAGIRLGAHSSQPAQYRALCDRYQREQASGLTLELVRACVKIYREAGQAGKARQLVDLAISKMPNPPAKQEFLKTIR